MKEIKFGKATNPRSSEGFLRISPSKYFPGQIFVAVHSGVVANMHLTYLQTKTLVRALSTEAEKLRKKKSK